MIVLKTRSKELLVYGLPLLVILSSAAIAMSPILKQHPELAAAITYDLTLTAPFLFLLLSRKSKTSKLKAIPFFILGILLASYLLPVGGQEHLNYIKAYALPIVELTAITFLIRKIYISAKAFRLNKVDTSDFLTISKTSARELFGESNTSAFISSEITMMYYALFSWKKKKRASNEFTNYRENASIALTLAFLMIICIETYTLHILLLKWSSIAAWGLTITSMYTALLIFGHLKALLQRPSIVSAENLILKNGLIADITVKLQDISTIELCTKEMNSEELKIGNLGLSKESTNHNIAIYFSKRQRIEKMYGFTEECDMLLLHIDEKNKYISRVNDQLQKLSV